MRFPLTCTLLVLMMSVSAGFAQDSKNGRREGCSLYQNDKYQGR